MPGRSPPKLRQQPGWRPKVELGPRATNDCHQQIGGRAELVWLAGPLQSQVVFGRQIEHRSVANRAVVGSFADRQSMLRPLDVAGPTSSLFRLPRKHALCGRANSDRATVPFGSDLRGQNNRSGLWPPCTNGHLDVGSAGNRDRVCGRGRALLLWPFVAPTES